MATTRKTEQTKAPVLVTMCIDAIPVTANPVVRFTEMLRAANPVPQPATNADIIKMHEGGHYRGLDVARFVAEFIGDASDGRDLIGTGATAEDLGALATEFEWTLKNACADEVMTHPFYTGTWAWILAQKAMAEGRVNVAQARELAQTIQAELVARAPVPEERRVAVAA